MNAQRCGGENLRRVAANRESLPKLEDLKKVDKKTKERVDLVKRFPVNKRVNTFPKGQTWQAS